MAKKQAPKKRCSNKQTYKMAKKQPPKKRCSNKQTYKMAKKQPPKKRSSNKRTYNAKQQEQIGGMLPGLIIGFIKAKLKKKKFNATNYLKDAIGKRVSVAKVVAGKKVPTPGNTGMSVGDFFKSGLFGM